MKWRVKAIQSVLVSLSEGLLMKVKKSIQRKSIVLDGMDIPLYSRNNKFSHSVSEITVVSLTSQSSKHEKLHVILLWKLHVYLSII